MKIINDYIKINNKKIYASEIDYNSYNTFNDTITINNKIYKAIKVQGSEISQNF